MKKWCLSLLMACCLILTLFSGCQQSSGPKAPKSTKDNGEPLTLYCGSEGSANIIEQIVEAYNRHAEPTDQLEIIPYAGDEGAAITTELISGKGPDLFFFSPIALEQLYPIMDKGLFQDLDYYFEKNGISLENYNQNIINAGVYEGRRMYVPCWYYTGFFLTTESKLRQFGIPSDISINNMDCSNLLPYLDAISAQGMTLFNMPPGIEFLVPKFVDYNKKTTAFSSEEFKTMAEQQKLLRSASGGQGSSDCVFTYGLTLGGLQGILAYMAENPLPDDKYLLIPETTLDGSEMAYLNNGSVAINSNSPNGERAFKFVEWLISEQTQSDTTIISNGVNSIHKAAFQTRIDQTMALSQQEQEIVRQYCSLSEAITSTCNIDIAFHSEIFYPLWSDYLDDKLTLEEFVSQLDSKANLYFKER